MGLDRAAAVLLEQMAGAEGPQITEQSPEDARVSANPAFAALGGEGEAVAAVLNRSIPGPDGEIPVRIYQPSGSGTFAGLVFFHGGGWVLGDLDTHDAACRAVCNAAGVTVVSVQYRLAPEHKFPAPLDDCFAALDWVAAHGSEIGVDGSRLAVGGDSAGGNLAAAVALRAKQRGGPALRHQLLVYPVTDHAYDTVSYTDNGSDYFLTTELMRWFWDHYLRSEADGDDPEASPLRAADADLVGLPPRRC